MFSEAYRQPIPRSALPGKGSVIAALLVLLAGGAGLIVALATIGSGSGGSPATSGHDMSAMSKPAPGLPNFEFISDNARMGFIRAQLYPDVFQHVGCYCGCALPQAALPHRSLEECFLKPGGGFQSHGAGCGVCGDIAAEVQKGIDAGLSHLEIRQAVDAKFREMAPNSLVPPPPSA